MRAHYQIGDDFSVLRIRNAGFKYADDGAGAIADAAEANGFADDRRIFSEDGSPEAVGQHDHAVGFGAVIRRTDQAAEDGVQPHHFEIGTADHAGGDGAGLTEANHGERYAGKFAELGDGADAAFQIPQFGHGKGGVFVAQAGGALADVDQPVFAAIDQGFEQHAAHEGEDGRVGADSQSQSQDDNRCEALGAAEGMECDSQITKKGHGSSLPNPKRE